MSIRKLAACVFTMVLTGFCANAQNPTSATNEQSVPLTEQAPAHDILGRPALTGRLRATDLHGAPDSPVRNIRLVISNVSPTLYTYISGWATFYDADGVRCGEGLFKANALAAGESVETDTPGLRLICSPATWRIVAINLITPTIDVAKPFEAALTGAKGPATAISQSAGARLQPLVLSIDGEDHPIQLGNPIVIKTGDRELRLVLKTAH